MNLSASVRLSLYGKRRRPLLAAAAAIVPFLSLEAMAQTPPAEDLDTVVIAGDRLDVMQNEPVSSVFGFGKSVEETPRAVTTISQELLEKTIITEIDDLVALSPGVFTQSFFGVAGSLDVRGTPGENYFRGIKRISNPGNYATPIGASSRVDIVRGPASPIYGPSQIGGYLNFVPKSARAETGKFLVEPTAQIGLNYGSYDLKTLHGEVGGPTTIGGKEAGYYLYGESTNAGSFYENTDLSQTIVQASFDVSLSDTWRAEFGGMYQFYRGNQVAGWNRLTQDLINNGTYITGSPRSLDGNGDGLLSDTESVAGGLGNVFFAAPFGATPASLSASLTANPNLALINPGTAKLRRNQVLVQEDDTLESDVTTLYFDLVGEYDSGLKVQNKLYYESLVNNNENIYGFSQFADTTLIEDQLIFSFEKEFGASAKAGFQFSPSIRYSDFGHGDNFDYEYFDRRDLTKPGSPIDRRGMATRGQEFFSSRTEGSYTDYGLALLMDWTFFDKLNVVVGGRMDYLDMDSRQLANVVSPASRNTRAQDTDNAFSWSASASYDLGMIRPYVTVARQSTLILGQGGEIPTSSLADGVAIAESKLSEIGFKGTLLDGRLFYAVDYYEQSRVDFSAQNTVTNNTTEAKGYEAELRFVVNPMLTVTGAYTNLKVTNLTAADDGFQFSFFGGQDLLNIGINPARAYGGTVGALVPTTDGRKAGIPENIYSLNFLLGFDQWVQGLSGTVSVSSVDAVASGWSQTVTLPSYVLVNTGVRYEKDAWSFGLAIKNATDEKYFRSNFPDLFGASVVLPELPRTFIASLNYKF